MQRQSASRTVGNARESNEKYGERSSTDDEQYYEKYNVRINRRVYSHTAAHSVGQYVKEYFPDVIVTLNGSSTNRLLTAW